MAQIKPDAVLFIATEILAANKLAFSAGLALAIEAKAEIKPTMVPNRLHMQSVQMVQLLIQKRLSVLIYPNLISI